MVYYEYKRNIKFFKEKNYKQITFIFWEEDKNEGNLIYESRCLEFKKQMMIIGGPIVNIQLKP